MTDWTIETRNLTKVYGEGVHEVRALDGVSITIAPGELVTVMGPSGSGKSTLLNMLGALDIPTSGEVFIHGQQLSAIKDKDTFRAQTVGFVFQLHNLIPTLTARENVEVPMMGHAGRSERRARSKELLERVGLGDRMSHLPGQLSGGQRQRVAIARALANDPALVLADEPTGSLDSVAGQDLLTLIRELNEGGTTFVLVTHDPAVARQTQRVIVMRDGYIQREDLIGSPLEEDLKMWRHTELGREILGGSNDLPGIDESPEQLKAIRDLLNAISEEAPGKTLS